MKETRRPLYRLCHATLLLFICISPLFASSLNPLENVVHFSPSSTGIYLGSPSIVRLPNGDLLVSMDMFGPKAPVTPDRNEKIGLIFRSKDNGSTWRCVAEIPGCHWANLFLHKGTVYLLGCSTQFGSIVIRKSEDNGETWTQPLDERTGLLFPADSGDAGPKYHCAPMPIVEYKGRLYRAFENNPKRQWPQGFRSLFISADANADLLLASSWTMSDEVVYDESGDPEEYANGAENLPGGKHAGWLEGNMVVGPDDNLYNVLRVNSLPVVDRAAMPRVGQDGKTLSFDPQTGFIEFPGGMTKFSIRRDPQTNRYWTLANGNTNPKNPTQRNVLSIYSSTDLRHWRQHETLLEDKSDFENIGNDSKVGFQYIDFQFDGDDIIFASRTAYRGAHTYHDANYITFHRIPDFRKRYAVKPFEAAWKKPLRGATVHVRLTQDDLRFLKENWHADSIRLMLMNGDVRSLEPPYTIQEEKLKKIDRFLDWCEELNLRCVLDVHETPGRVEWGGEKDRRLWEEYRFHDLLDETWAVLSKRYAERGGVIAGYDLFNEPNMDKQVPGTPSDWNALAKRLTQTIRKFDQNHAIIVEPIQWGSASGFQYLEPTGDPNTVYSFHFYIPHQFTHQNVHEEVDPISYPGEIQGKHWDKKALVEAMQPAVDFQKKTGCQIYVGEFSVIRWAPGDSDVNYLKDVLSLFETNGWSWSYHAFREWPGWSLEHEGPKSETKGPLPTTDRLNLLQSYWNASITD